MFEGEENKVREIIKRVVPPKVVLLFWQACLNKLATKQNLQRRGVIVDEFDLCCVCNLMEDTSDHIFLLCPKVQDI